MTCGCRGLSISFTSRGFTLVVSVVSLCCFDELFHNRTGLIDICLRDEHLHGSDTAGET